MDFRALQSVNAATCFAFHAKAYYGGTPLNGQRKNGTLAEPQPWSPSSALRARLRTRSSKPSSSPDAHFSGKADAAGKAIPRNVKCQISGMFKKGIDVLEEAVGDHDVQKGDIQGDIVLQKTYLFDVTDYSATISDLGSEIFGERVSLQLVSRDKIDEKSGMGKTSEPIDVAWSPYDGVVAGDTKYKIAFKWDASELGTPGAILVKNMHKREFFLKSLTLTIPGQGDNVLYFHCNSWIYPTPLYKADRVFFVSKSYLPEETPAGLTSLRDRELVDKRGDGTGERKIWDRIYDYDLYNDLGEPDESPEKRRNVLGGSEEFPYPRRCRTGRPRTKTDPVFESRGVLYPFNFYIPPDEKFPRSNLSDYRAHLIRAASEKIVPSLKTFHSTEFKSLEDVKSIYSQGIPSDINNIMNIGREIVPLDLVKGLLSTQTQALINYPLPPVFKSDERAWMTDEEYARQTLAGLNPMAIQCLRKFPPISGLDPAIYGPQESSITEAHIEKYLGGLSVEQAIQSQKLFIVDYHDVYTPYVERINQQSGKTYATRTVFFLTNGGTLKPIAIELTRPPTAVREGDRTVYTPADDGEQAALWLLAKGHARVNDAGVHQLVSHWLRTHAVVEPFIIATHRQLSAMHPLHKLLIPHFLDTMDINQSARQSLISAGGIIEQGFTPGRYSIEMSSKAYISWKFNEQGLPADLLKRGMAARDPKSAHGLRLVIEDYPYAVDGLEIWDALKSWVSDYLSVYYKDDAAVKADKELQSWWTEIINIGHGDKKNDPTGWYDIGLRDELIEAITTLIWIASAHHAAVNFGQYAYGGYMPNLPTFSRRLVPVKGSKEFSELVENPEAFFLKTVSSPSQATTVMTTLELLSQHSTDEVYIGQEKGSTLDWTDDARIKDAFKRFTSKLQKIEKNVSERNKNSHLKNRTGPAKFPYTLLYPETSDVSSTGGLTAKGIPNSISI